MSVFPILIYIIAVFLLIIGLLLSSSGTTGGLAALSGHDLELFKKTKDYGIIKILKFVMLFLIFLLLLFIALSAKFNAPLPK